jgi:ferredoxin/mono/diheme cytochrome c family protein
MAGSADPGGEVRFRRALTGLERATLAVERPLRRVVASNRLNPLPHAGTISVFLLIVVTISGIYLTFFFPFGFEASYQAVARLEAHPIQRAARALHRYASGALVLTTLVHAWRTFVMARFTGPRRWRWATGVAALVIVWLAGVTGYWLIWDVRAQAITEALIRLLEGFGAGVSLVVNRLVGSAAGSGWQVIFVIWLAHLLLTGVVGWFLWRHLRRTRHRWLPPRHWMWIMGGALLLVSVLVPAGMLAAADFTTMPGAMPLDPFFLFLLPLFLSSWPWGVVVIGGLLTALALGIPWLLRRSDPGVVVIDEDACTGCNLCVVDCPYEALTLVDRPAGEQEARHEDRPVAVVEPDACVACGICIGSCSFGAMSLPGFEAVPAVEAAGRHVILTCERHRRHVGSPGPGAVVVSFACAGMVHPQVIGRLTQAGAASIQVVGCPPADCAFGRGNQILSERLEGERRPHLARAWLGAATQDWVAPSELVAAAAEPGSHPSADAGARPLGRRTWIAAVAVVVASVTVVVLATEAPWRPIAEAAEIVVIVDHLPGRELEGGSEPVGTPGSGARLDVSVDGEAVLSDDLAAGPPGGDQRLIALRRVAVGPGVREVEVALVDGATGIGTVVFSGTSQLPAGTRLVVEARDAPPPDDVVQGERIFSATAIGGGAGCVICHSIEPGDGGVGPSLYGVAVTAATRVPGLSAEEYLRQSIVEPDAYVVDGYPAGQMLPIYEERLSPQEIDALVAYLMTLDGGG